MIKGLEAVKHHPRHLRRHASACSLQQEGAAAQKRRTRLCERVGGGVCRRGRSGFVIRLVFGDAARG